MFKKIGYTPQSQLFNAEVYPARGANRPQLHSTRNIIAELKGTTSCDQIVIVGAHYDTEYLSPGANDNATGVAALLEIARAIQLTGALNRTIRFVAFSNEEQPFCRTDQMGSRIYAAKCHDNNEQIAAMICLETIGFYTDQPGSQKFPEPFNQSLAHDAGNFLAIVSNLESEPLLKECATAFRSAVRFPSIALSATETVRGLDYSDHQSFWRLGYSAVMVTDTAFFRYPHYHERTDTPDKIDFDRLAVVSTGLTAIIKKIASSAAADPQND
jgi:Zn-dependent M28 family amino/carboxypeptidase